MIDALGINMKNTEENGTHKKKKSEFSQPGQPRRSSRLANVTKGITETSQVFESSIIRTSRLEPERGLY